MVGKITYNNMNMTSLISFLSQFKDTLGETFFGSSSVVNNMQLVFDRNITGRIRVCENDNNVKVTYANMCICPCRNSCVEKRIFLKGSGWHLSQS